MIGRTFRVKTAKIDGLCCSVVRGQHDSGKNGYCSPKTHFYWDISGKLKLKMYLGGILAGNHICLYTSHLGPLGLGTSMFLLEARLLPLSRRTSCIRIIRQLSCQCLSCEFLPSLSEEGKYRREKGGVGESGEKSSLAAPIRPTKCQIACLSNQQKGEYVGARYCIVSHSPPNSRVKALTPNVAVCGDGAYEEVIKVKEGHKGEVLIPITPALCKKRNRCQSFLSTM